MKKFYLIGSIVIAVVAVVGVYYFYPTNNFKIEVVSPAGNEKLEVGNNNTYEIKWINNSNQVPASIALQTLASDGTELGYHNIATSSLSAIQEGRKNWIPDNLNTDYTYRIVFFNSKREIIGMSNKFSVVNNIPNEGDIVIESKYIFTLGKPFVMEGNVFPDSTLSQAYATSDTYQKSIFYFRIRYIWNDACDRTPNTPDCPLKGEQLVRLVFNSPESKDVYLSTKTHNIDYLSKETGIDGQYRVYDKYQVELLAIDIQNKEVKLLIKKIGTEQRPL